MTLKQLLNQLENMGVERPKAMPVKMIKVDVQTYNNRKEAHFLSGFEPNLSEVSDLEAYLEPWETIVGIAIPYGLKSKQTLAEPCAVSRVSIMAWEWDYHQTLRASLNAALVDLVDYKIHIDSGPLPERSIAIQMGLATAGRNQMLIHPKYGTAFYLAFILTNIEMTDDISPLEFQLAEDCKDCYKCQKICPSGALMGASDFDGMRCISALTQKKGLLSDWESKAIGCQLYGCDLCQVVCPANTAVSGLEAASHSFPVYRETPNRLDPRSLLNLSQKAFQRAYGHTGFAWRGVKTMKRNALINMANDQQPIWQPVVAAYLQEPTVQADEVLLQTAQWALKKLMPEK